MNDPGLEDTISNDAKVIESQKQSNERDEAEEDEQAFLAPSRWWFASTAFPLIAGTLGPMASAFSICALAIHWRVSVPLGTSEASGTYLDDPPWLIGINAAQLVVALTSNLFLLLNMAESVRFSIAQPITILGWYISAFTLAGLTAAVASLDSGSDAKFSQAYYYAIFSAGLYFIVASLLTVTVIGAWMGQCDKEFKLTMSQRTLMLQTISFLVYLLVGSAVYARIEGWYFLDAVYWADFTLLTVGIGDISPTTDVGRGLLFPYAIGGIIILGLVIGSIRSLVLERGKLKLGARMLEKERNRILKRIHRKKRALLIPIKGNVEGDDEGLTERQRREKEFNLMRKVQENAAARRRWTSLAISATTWFALWFFGAAIFQVSEYGEQDWTYFEGLYFAYTSLLTIGYGDLFPVSNAGKPFFVFWSLLAVPSLTILISNMGDTIVKSIRDLTLWIGTLTILPGEHGVRSSLKMTIQRITGRKIFRGSLKEEPPGILGELDAQGPDKNNNSGGGTRDRHRKNDPEGTAQRAASGQADIEAKKAQEEGKTGDERALPKSKRHYHAMLIKELSSVMRHLNSSPPRKYSFDEWAWYLKLIGEDENSAETHRQPVRHPSMGDKGAIGKKIDEQSEKKVTVKWSWVGNRSPLMGNKEEAEWVLERLTRTLERELEAMKTEDKEFEGRKEGQWDERKD